MFTQEWTADIRDKERYEMYRSFKVMFGAEKYLSAIDIYCFRVALTQLRLGVLPINSNMYRYSDCPTDKNCVFCQNLIENEDHFLLVCPLDTDLRSGFLEQKRYSLVTEHIEKEKHKRLSTATKVHFPCYQQKKNICR